MNNQKEHNADGMGSHGNYVALANSAHQHPEGHTMTASVGGEEQVENILIFIRRGPHAETHDHAGDFRRKHRHKPASDIRDEFREQQGAAQDDIDAVTRYVQEHNLTIVNTSREARTVEVCGKAADVNNAFSITLNMYASPRGNYRSHEGHVHVPAQLSGIVENVMGLDNRPAKAKHFGAPAGATPIILSPQEVAQMYNFPQGTGQGQTVGIYEMVTSDGPPGYAIADIEATMAAFGGGLTAPTPQDVPVGGQNNSGQSDGETLLDITVCSAVAQGAAIAVYFTGGTTTDIVMALQQMIHPQARQPAPTIISISYGWGPDDDPSSQNEFNQINQLFEDAANLNITVLVSSGDSGAQIESQSAQASFPASSPWVTACGGTLIQTDGSTFTEFVWNDPEYTFNPPQQGGGATGGGVSALFPVPGYQAGFNIPTQITTGQAGRGLPDIAGNASPFSGYPQVIGGQNTGPIGGTSAVAPLYAGLVALINANLGTPAGFINPLLYSSSQTTVRNIFGPPGATDNTFQGVQGYPATTGWNACTGLGVVNGATLQTAIQNATASAATNATVAA